MKKIPGETGVPRELAENDFRDYEATFDDLEALRGGIETLDASGLVEADVLNEIRFVTHDSKYLYVVTKGRHASTETFVVERVDGTDTVGWKTYRIPYSKIVGSELSYRGARAWLLCDEIETTAVGARTFPNENALLQPDLPQPKSILDVVSMGPKGPYDRIQKGKFDYLADVIFHEAGHIEHRRLTNWQEGEEIADTFPSADQANMFLSVISSSGIFSKRLMAQVIDNISHRAIAEMYAMLVDREAAKRYDRPKFDRDSPPTETESLSRVNKPLKSGHAVGRLLVRILEDRYPTFEERKAFVQSVLKKQARQ